MLYVVEFYFSSPGIVAFVFVVGNGPYFELESSHQNHLCIAQPLFMHHAPLTRENLGEYLVVFWLILARCLCCY